MADGSKIDVHSHFLPSFYRKACLETGHGKPDGMPALPEWSEDTHLEFMRDTSISKSIISISSPGVHLFPGSKNSNINLARECNDFAHDLVSRHPEKFGFWASLPLPDVEGSLAEIAHCTRELNATGFVLETNHDGAYLGDPSLDAVFAELNRVKAKLFIHPTTPCCNHIGGNNDNGRTPITFLPKFPNPIFEFMFDTARALINLFSSGTISRCPNITFIIPHAAGALPPILQRFSSISSMLMPSELDLSNRALKETFKKQFFFDLAGFPFPDQIHGLLRIVDPDRLLYGSDYPFTPAMGVKMLAIEMRNGLEEIFEDKAVKEGIYSGNAKGLLA
ncbi:amidohydrolase 2 [Stipitochalara longipes BDJ]|nr:amidohydrolase 2 [Stipitochalara longipes BDJ]